MMYPYQRRNDMIVHAAVVEYVQRSLWDDFDVESHACSTPTQNVPMSPTSASRSMHVIVAGGRRAYLHKSRCLDRTQQTSLSTTSALFDGQVRTPDAGAAEDGCDQGSILACPLHHTRSNHRFEGPFCLSCNFFNEAVQPASSDDRAKGRREKLPPPTHNVSLSENPKARPSTRLAF